MRSQLSPVARLLGMWWDESRPLPATARLVLPHVVLAAGGGATTAEAARGLAAQAARPGWYALEIAVHESEREGRSSRDVSPGRTGSVSATTARITEALAVTARAFRVARDVAEAAAPGTSPRALLTAWDAAATSVDDAAPLAPVGRDHPGSPWMPVLGRLRPGLPFDPLYRDLGRERGGAAAQLVLLAVAAEAGRPDPGMPSLDAEHCALARHTGLSDAAVRAALAALAGAGWITRGPRGGAHAARYGCRIASARADRILRTPTAI